MELVALAIFVAIAVKYVFIDGGGTGGLSLDPIYQPGNVDLSFIRAATSIAVLSFLGFDGISTLAEETERSERTVGNATVAALLILGAIFVTQTYLAALVQPNFKGLDPELAFFEVARATGGPFLYYMLLVVNVVVVGIANALAAQLAISRILYSVSRVVTLAVALIFALDTITKFVNFGVLTAFMALNISVIAYFFVRQGRRSGRDLFFLPTLPAHQLLDNLLRVAQLRRGDVHLRFPLARGRLHHRRHEDEGFQGEARRDTGAIASGSYLAARNSSCLSRNSCPVKMSACSIPMPSSRSLSYSATKAMVLRSPSSKAKASSSVAGAGMVSEHLVFGLYQYMRPPSQQE